MERLLGLVHAMSAKMEAGIGPRCCSNARWGREVLPEGTKNPERKKKLKQRDAGCQEERLGNRNR
jgi:hypothetical protein